MTRQRFARADQSDSDCTPASDGNKPLLATQTGGGETVSASVVAQTMNSHIFEFSMAAGDPGGGEDLAASSLFTARLDVSVGDANLTFRVEFHALDASCVSQGSVAMGESIFSGTGTKTATATWDPPIADRYAVRVIANSLEGHTGPAHTITIRTNNTITDLVIPNAPAAPGGGPRGPLGQPLHGPLGGPV